MDLCDNMLLVKYKTTSKAAFRGQSFCFHLLNIKLNFISLDMVVRSNKKRERILLKIRVVTI